MQKKLLKSDYSLNLLTKLVTVALGFVSSAFLSRYLGVALRGEYAYILQTTTILFVLLDAGIHQAYSYFYRTSEGKVLPRFAALFIALLILYSTISALALLFVTNVALRLIFMYLPTMILYQQFETMAAVECIRLKSKLHMLTAILKFLLFLLLLLAFQPNILYPLLALIALNLLSVVIYVIKLREQMHPLQLDMRFAGQAVAFGWIPMINYFLTMLVYGMDVMMLKHLGSPEDLGIYSTAIGIVTYFWLIPDAFKEVLVSRVSRKDSDSSVIFSIKTSLLFFFVTAVAFLLLGQPAIRLVYGKDFIAAYPVTLGLTLGAFWMIFYKMIGVLLLAEGKRVYYFWSMALSVLVNAVLNFVLIPLLGMYGSVISAVVTYTVCGFSFLRYFAITRKKRIKDIVMITQFEVKLALRRLRRKAS